jgi:hypothetical protein
VSPVRAHGDSLDFPSGLAIIAAKPANAGATPYVAEVADLIMTSDEVLSVRMESPH